MHPVAAECGWIFAELTLDSGMGETGENRENVFSSIQVSGVLVSHLLDIIVIVYHAVSITLPAIAGQALQRAVSKFAAI